MTATEAVCQASFFDLDETLVTQKTMFSFLRHHFTATGRPPEEYERAHAHIVTVGARSGSREEANRAYYTLYAGESAAVLAEHGEVWFREQLDRGGFFHEPGVAALRRHRAAGHRTVIVSGSFFPCLDPIARHLGVDEVFGTEVLVVDGRLTGDIVRPMIGEAKGELVSGWTSRHGVAAADCFAYGDHSSDLDLLSAVGHPVAVGDDPVLRAHVARTGGRTLPGVTPNPGQRPAR